MSKMRQSVFFQRSATIIFGATLYDLFPTERGNAERENNYYGYVRMSGVAVK
jgi:hypothetical protein